MCLLFVIDAGSVAACVVFLFFSSWATPTQKYKTERGCGCPPLMIGHAFPFRASSLYSANNAGYCSNEGDASLFALHVWPGKTAATTSTTSQHQWYVRNLCVLLRCALQTDLRNLTHADHESPCDGNASFSSSFMPSYAVKAIAIPGRTCKHTGVHTDVSLLKKKSYVTSKIHSTH
jgi:hypothetical protein